MPNNNNNNANKSSKSSSTNETKATEEKKKKKKRYRGKSQGNKPTDSGNTPYSMNGSNDVSWYTRYPELMDNAANYPFNHIAGEPVIFGNTSVSKAFDLPVGMVLNYIRTPGRMAKASDAYNWQVRELWLKMHRKYRGMGGYDWSDLGAALFAIMNAFADFGRAERVYGLASKFITLNRSYPDVILSALRVNVSSITGDALADYRYQLNRLILKAKMLCLPKGITALDAFLTLDSQIFKDSDSSRAMWYLYDCPYRVVFDSTTTGTGSACLYKARKYTGGSQGYGNTQLLSDIIQDLEDQIDVLLTDSDVIKMCSDIIACFGMDGFTALSALPENYEITAIRDDTRLLQLHNSTLNGSVYSDRVPAAVTWPATSPIMLYQTGPGGYLEFKLATTGSATGTKISDSNGNQFYGITTSVQKAVGNTPLDIWKDSVSKEDIIEMTRQATNCGTQSITSGGTTYYNDMINAFGLIVVMNAEVWNNYRSSSSPYGQRTCQFTSDAGTWGIDDYAKLEPCDWHMPLLNTTSPSYHEIWFFDVDNPKGMDVYTLDRIHQAAVMSAYSIPTAMTGDNTK